FQKDGKAVLMRNDLLDRIEDGNAGPSRLQTCAPRHVTWIEAQDGYVGRVVEQDACFAQGCLLRADDCKPLAGHLQAVADGAQPHATIVDALAQSWKGRRAVYYPGRQNEPTRAD